MKLEKVNKMNLSAIEKQFDLAEFVSLSDCKKRIFQWLNDASIAEVDKEEILNLISNKDVKELRERFYRELEFGTGGLRGVIGSGNNRMNRYVVRRAAHGLAQYIKKQGAQAMARGVAIAHDSRHFSNLFAKEAASVLAGNGIRSFLFPTLQTTPALSFAIRKLNCISGICVTASHNPPQYNGFKVYWDDGAQIIPPHDSGILAEVFKVQEWSEPQYMDFEAGIKSEIINWISDEVLDCYAEELKKLQIYPELANQSNLNIVYTPLHGTGAVPARRAVTEWGYGKNFFIVPEQEKPDGQFPTVQKPNPEEPAALKLAVEYAAKRGAQMALATDPDSDRLALVVLDKTAAQGPFSSQAIGDYVLLNGNQTGALLIDYILTGLSAQKKLLPQHKIIKTIVTSDFHSKICAKYNVDIFETLTGFKWIAGLVRSWEQKGLKDFKYLFGTEESFGFMPGDYVRDKDGIGALCQTVEMVAWLKSINETACTRLLKLFSQFGAWHEDLISIDLIGEEGAKRIGRLMNYFRDTPPLHWAGSQVSQVLDYKTHQIFDIQQGQKILKKEILTLPSSDVLQFVLSDGSRISMRPSGTEPKLKIYTSVCTLVQDSQKSNQDAVVTAYATSKNRIEKLRSEFDEVLKKIV